MGAWPPVSRRPVEQGPADGGPARCYPESRKPGATIPSNNEGKRNTTGQSHCNEPETGPAQLQRLATHVHSSMSRAITPSQLNSMVMCFTP